MDKYTQPLPTPWKVKKMSNIQGEREHGTEESRIYLKGLENLLQKHYAGMI